MPDARCPGCGAWSPREAWPAAPGQAFPFRIVCPRCGAVADVADVDYRLGVAELTWPCMVCGDERPDELIDVVQHYELIAGGRTTMGTNVRYCKDRPACRAAAERWPTVGGRGLTELEVEAAQRGLAAVRDLDDGRELTIQVIGAGQGRLTIGPRPSHGMYEDAFDYQSVAEAWRAMNEWDGHGDAPTGWFRNLGTDRRRTGGDPDQEYIRP